MQSDLRIKVSAVILPTIESYSSLLKEFFPEDAAKSELLNAELGKSFFPYSKRPLLFYCGIVRQLIPHQLNGLSLLIVRIYLLLIGISPQSIKTRYTCQAVRLLCNLHFLLNNLSWFQSSTKPMSQSYLKLGVPSFLKQIFNKLELLVAFIVKFRVLIYFLESK